MRRLLPLGPRLRSLVRKPLRLLPLIAILGLLAASLEGLGIGLIIPLLSIMMNGGASSARGFSHVLQQMGAGLAPQSRLAAIAAVILGLILLKNIVAGANAVLSAWMYGKSSHAIRTGLAVRLTQVGYPFFGQQSPGRLLSTISTESWRASDAIGTSLIILVNGAATASLFLFLCLLSWRMTIAVGLGLIAIQMVQGLISRPLRAMSRDVTAHNSELASRMLHLVEGARLIRIFGQAVLEQRLFERTSDAVRKHLFALESRRALIPPIMETLYSVLFIAVVLGAWMAKIGFAQIAAFLVLLYRMQPNVRNIQSASAQLQSLSGSLEAVEWLLDPSGKPIQGSGPEAHSPLKRGIRFQDVAFDFESDTGRTPVLGGVSFELRAGRSTALVGRSGAGKTTIINLLCRFLEPDRGAIWIDERLLSDLDVASWRSGLALASQDLDLIEGTVAENIAYGQPDATRQDIHEAARMADAHDFILNLPDGYDTLTGHRGAHLSAGQRQRVALARALLRDPDVLILDEATSAVDGLSERSIIETLKSRAGRGATIVVSHHRKTLSFCDDVVILEEGRVKASLPLAQLADVDMDGLYRHEDATTAA